MKFSKKQVMVISLIAGVILLTGSVLANFGSANGYRETKDAVISLIFEDNFTVEAEMYFSINGEAIERERVLWEIDMGNDVSRRREVSSYNYLTDWSSDLVFYYQDGLVIRQWFDSAGEIMDYNVWSDHSRGNENWLGIRTDEHSIRFANRVITFAEFAADTVMGGLKSNIVMVADEDGIRTYELNLSRRQIPGLFQSGISLLFASQGYISYANPEHARRDPVYMLGDDPVIDFVKISTSVDRDGNLRAVNFRTALVGERNGERNTVEFSFNARLWDFGTTSIERLDISSIHDEVERFENHMTEHMQAHFDSHVEFLESLDLSDEELNEVIREFEQDLIEAIGIEHIRELLSVEIEEVEIEEYEDGDVVNAESIRD